MSGRETATITPQFGPGTFQYTAVLKDHEQAWKEYEEFVLGADGYPLSVAAQVFKEPSYKPCRGSMALSTICGWTDQMVVLGERVDRQVPPTGRQRYTYQLDTVVAEEALSTD